jgi:hypothetical protein
MWRDLREVGRTSFLEFLILRRVFESRDALGDHQLRQGVGHCERAHHQLLEANFLRFIFFDHRLFQQLSQLDATSQNALRQQTQEPGFCARS